MCSGIFRYAYYNGYPQNIKLQPSQFLTFPQPYSIRLHNNHLGFTASGFLERQFVPDTNDMHMEAKCLFRCDAL